MVGNADSPWRWVIDPIDGTSNFVRGIPIWATLIGLTHQDEGPVVGVVSAPALGRRWWAARGLGAFADGKPCHVSTVTDLAEAQVCVTFSSGWDDAGLTDKLVTLLQGAYRARARRDFWQHMLVAEGAIDLAIDAIGWRHTTRSHHGGGRRGGWNLHRRHGERTYLNDPRPPTASSTSHQLAPLRALDWDCLFADGMIRRPEDEEEVQVRRRVQDQPNAETPVAGASTEATTENLEVGDLDRDREDRRRQRRVETFASSQLPRRASRRSRRREPERGAKVGLVAADVHQRTRLMPAGDDRNASKPCDAPVFVDDRRDGLARPLDLRRGPPVRRNALEVAGSDIVEHAGEVSDDIVRRPRRSRWHR